MSVGAQNALKQLLHDAGVPPPRLGSLVPYGITDPLFEEEEGGGDSEDEEEEEDPILACDGVTSHIPNTTTTAPKEEEEEKETVIPPELELARKGKASLFASILRLFESSDDHEYYGDELSTNFIIRKCSLMMRPVDVPTCMDA
eukprot:13743015-Ditylum_brightwellii.AAC.1